MNKLEFHDAQRPNIIRFVRNGGRIYIEVEGKHGGQKVFHTVEVDSAKFSNDMKGWLA